MIQLQLLTKDTRYYSKYKNNNFTFTTTPRISGTGLSLSSNTLNFNGNGTGVVSGSVLRPSGDGVVSGSQQILDLVSIDEDNLHLIQILKYQHNNL